MTIPTTLEFFQALYGAAPDKTACVSLFLVRRSDGKKVSVHVPLTDLPRAVDTASKADNDGCDVYFGVCLRRPGLGTYERGSEDDIVYVPGLWIDIDYGTIGHAAEDLPPDAETALELLDASADPNIIVDTGGGLHAYVIRPGATKRDVRAFQKYVAEGFKAENYHVDMLADLARVLRVPGTHNHKVGTPRPVTITYFDPTAKAPVRKDLIDVRISRVESGASSPETGLRVGRANRDSGGDDRSDREDSRKGSRSQVGQEDLRERLKQVSSPDLSPLAQAVLNGTPFAPRGQRDAALYRICAMLANIDPEADPESLVEVLRPTIEATAERDGDWDVEEILEIAHEKLTRALDRAQERKEQDADFIALCHELATKGGALEAPTPAPPPAEGTPPAHQLIISKGDAYFVWCQGVGYKAPIRERELLVRLRDDWFTGEKLPGVVPGKINEIRSAYSTVARHLVSDMSMKVSKYDEREETFYEAVCPQRDLTPVFHQQIDDWLRLLGGDHADKLLDWVATIGRLDQYSSALYLAGATGAGKSLLVKGLARRWKSGPTELKRILENFNEDLAKCPLVFADEELPATYHGKPSTAIIRELVTSKSRTLSRKFLPPSDLRGAIRIVVAANNDNLLSMGNERLTPADLEAFGQRFLHIRAPEKAAEYLRSIGGQEVVSSWVDSDLIAQHSLWLEQNRPVKSGARFLVEGIPSILKRILATRGRLTALACEWLARHLDKPNPSVEASQYRVISGRGQLGVHAACLVDHWECYIRSDDRPSVANLSDALKHISHEKPLDVSGLNYYSVDVEMFLDWARDHSVGDVNRMRSRIFAGATEV